MKLKGKIKDFFKRNAPEYIHLCASWQKYWIIYGGSKALLRSPYFHFSLLFSSILYFCWRAPDSKAWFDIILSAIPNILGFTLGGYAILLAFGDEKFREFISGPEKDGTPSPFMSVNSSFVHFIVIQIVSLLLAIIGVAFDIDSGILAWIGLLSFTYAIMTAIAAALGILRLADWFDRFKSANKKCIQK